MNNAVDRSNAFWKVFWIIAGIAFVGWCIYDHNRVNQMTPAQKAGYYQGADNFNRAVNSNLPAHFRN